MTKKKATKPDDSIAEAMVAALDGIKSRAAAPVDEPCAVCGRLRIGLAPSEPCPTCGKQLEDTP